MGERPRGRLPWFLVAASALLGVLLFYVMFAAYLPLKQRTTQLEGELRDLYRREAELHTRLAREEKRYSQRDRQMVALAQERNELARRVEALERQLAAAKQKVVPAPARGARRR